MFTFVANLLSVGRSEGRRTLLTSTEIRDLNCLLAFVVRDICIESLHFRVNEYTWQVYIWNVIFL